MIYANYQPPAELSDEIKEKMIAAQIDCEANAIKQNTNATIEIRKSTEKMWIRSLEKELNRAAYHDVIINSDGVACESYTSSDPKKPNHYICNARHLTLTRLIHWHNATEQIFRLDCLLNEKHHSIFLDPFRIGSGAYLCRIFSSVGITFFADSLSLRKEYATKMLAILIASCTQKELVFDAPGWYITSEGAFTFVNKEVPTWTQITQMIH